ncbi:unnamed protein product [Zymoseptoria tritici ST99CH_3D7]|uniref:Uncharacterized protein n=1 Tax=Zymoseptoria tritici (strain ST99CH_3D7) TaxID=1276538 RepID=A0A1X7S8L6_ZYMT9|nr:unnamed protein product [Zymoseptoria tritici ST99CH_3D7]
MAIEPNRTKAFEVIVKQIDALAEKKRPNTKPAQLKFVQGLIAKYDLLIATAAGKVTDDGKKPARKDVVTPDPEKLRDLFMAYCARSEEGLSGNDVFLLGSAALPDNALRKINFTRGRKSAAARKVVNAATTASATTSKHGPKAPGPEATGVEATVASADGEGEDATTSLVKPESQLADALPRQKTTIHIKKQREVDQRKLATPPLPTPSDLATSPDSSTLQAVPTLPVVSTPPSTSTPQLTFTSPTASASPQIETPPKRQLEDPTPEQSPSKRPNNGKQRAVEPSTGPAPPSRTFRSYPWNAPIIDDPDTRMDNVYRHIENAIWILFKHYQMDANGSMALPPANPSHSLEILYELAIGRAGQSWASNAKERFIAGDLQAFFFQSVLGAGVYKEIFSKPVPWKTPRQILEHDEFYTAAASELYDYYAVNERTSLAGIIFNAGANMIRRGGAPQDGEKGFHEHVVDPLASRISLGLFTILRELFQPQIDSPRPTDDLEKDRTAWTRAGDLLTVSCKEALMLRGLYETVPVDVDITWVQPGTRFHIPTMKSEWGWRPGHPGVEEPFEVTMSLMPRVTSEPGQQWDKKGSCWLKAKVGIRPLNKVPPTKKGEGIPMEA